MTRLGSKKNVTLETALCVVLKGKDRSARWQRVLNIKKQCTLEIKSIVKIIHVQNKKVGVSSVGSKVAKIYKINSTISC